nr:hypothetical protein [Tanacetum cinerariifolium]
GEGSGTPTEPHHIPSPEAQQTSPTTHSSPTLLPVTTAPIPTVTLSDTSHLRQYTRRARIAQSSALPPIADEPASPLRDVSQGEACSTGYSLDAEQDRENIAKTSTLPHESTSRSDLVSKFEAQELEINSGEVQVVLTAAEVANATVSIPAGSDVVPTASPSFATATIVTPYTRRKCKEKMVETDTPKKKKFQEHMDIQMARKLEEEMERDA